MTTVYRGVCCWAGPEQIVLICHGLVGSLVRPGSDQETFHLAAAAEDKLARRPVGDQWEIVAVPRMIDFGLAKNQKQKIRPKHPRNKPKAKHTQTVHVIKNASASLSAGGERRSNSQVWEEMRRLQRLGVEAAADDGAGEALEALKEAQMNPFEGLPSKVRGRGRGKREGQRGSVYCFLCLAHLVLCGCQESKFTRKLHYLPFTLFARSRWFAFLVCLIRGHGIGGESQQSHEIPFLGRSLRFSPFSSWSLLLSTTPSQKNKQTKR